MDNFIPPDGFISVQLINWLTFGFSSSDTEEKISSFKACANIFYYITYPEEYINDSIFDLILA